MKIGCCVNMVAKDAAGTGVHHIDTLAQLGYDYIEIPLAQVMALEEAAFEALVSQVQENGIPCLACNNFFPATLRITGATPTSQEELKDYVKRALDRAEKLGAKSVVFGSSGAKNIPDGFPYDAAWKQVVALLQMIDTELEGRDIRVAIEPLNQQESNMIITAAEGLKLAKAVNRPRIRLLIDFYHLSMENEDLAIIGEAADYLQHMHLANPIGRVWPKKDDNADYSAFIRALKQARYNGCVSIEAFSDDFEHDAKEAIAVMREMIQSEEG